MDNIDDLVGKRIKARRLSLNMTQKELSEQIGVSFQQLQKYETGTNRVSASRLWQIALALDFPIARFFEGIHLSDDARPIDNTAYLCDADSIELVDLFARLPDGHQDAVLSFVRSLAQ